MREAKELSSATEEYYAFPLEENLFEWHFTIRGQPGTEFDGGLYHGRILLPSTYPMQPPYIIFLTVSVLCVTFTIRNIFIVFSTVDMYQI